MCARILIFNDPNMAYYYKTGISNEIDETFDNRLLLHKMKSETSQEPRINFDFSKHVLIELLDDVSSEKKLWKELGLTRNKSIVHKRMMIDTHRIRCRRAIVICVSAEEAKKTAERLSQLKIGERTICAVVVQELLSDMCLFEKQITNCGDKRSQEQLLYVTDLKKPRKVPDLIQFLKDKFSPFGTILSVLVSINDDGMASPEGVIKFAYLSETYAAELALDQYIIGKERLTVTTHHNIMLSQCDLRLRLREAHWSQINSSTSDYVNFKSYSSQVDPAFHSTINTDKTLSFGRNGRGSSIITSVNENNNLNNEFNIHGEERNSISSEMNEIFENTCHPSLVKCLHSLKKCNDETVLYTHDGDRTRNVEPSMESHVDNNFSVTSKRTTFSASTLPLCAEAWSSKVISWMAGMSDSSKHTLETNENTLLNHADQQRTEEAVVDETSTVESYRTCEKGDCSSEASKSVDGDADKSDNSTPLVCNITALHNKSKGLKINLDSTAEPFLGKIINAEPKSITTTPVGFGYDAGDMSNMTASQKRKKHFHLSQKLSLKLQKSGSSQRTPRNKDISLETSPSDAVLKKKENPLNLIHELNGHNSEFEKTTQILGDTQCLLLNESEVSNAPPNCNKGSEEQYTMKKMKSKANHADDLCNGEGLSLIENLANRKSVRLASRFTKFQLNGRSSATNLVDQHLLEDIENVDPDSNANSNSTGKNGITLIQSWLKRELIFATNNRISSSKDTSKKIVCATLHKDLIIPVGCSNMTCSSCYPESVNLLLGY